MHRTSTMQKCRVFFILYFIVIAVFPYSHSHADNDPYSPCSDVSAYSSVNGVFCGPDVRHSDRFTDGHTSHNDRHLHFMAEDSNPASRQNVVKETAPLSDVAISEMAIAQLSKPVIAVLHDRAQSCSDGFHPPYSGLSPPSC